MISARADSAAGVLASDDLCRTLRIEMKGRRRSGNLVNEIRPMVPQALHQTHETALPIDALLVRPLRREDRAGWLQLWADYHAYGRSGGAALPDAVTEATWERFFHEHEPMAALIAELEGRPVGLAHMVFHRGTSVAGPDCFLQDLFVEATLRGRGIGRALIEAVYAHAEAAGARRVYWHVLETNAAAMRLYDKVASRSGHVVYRKDL